MLRDEVTFHSLIFFFKDSAARVKKLLLSIFIGVVFIYLKYFFKCNWNSGMPTLDECFLAVRRQKIVTVQ